MRVLLALAVVSLLAACTDGPPVSTPPALTYANLQPIRINAAKIEVVDKYKPPMQSPNIEHTFRLPPYTAAEQLLKHQLVAAGSENELRAIIQEASVVSEEIPPS